MPICTYCNQEHPKDFACKPYVDSVASGRANGDVRAGEGATTADLEAMGTPPTSGVNVMLQEFPFKCPDCGRQLAIEGAPHPILGGMGLCPAASNPNPGRPWWGPSVNTFEDLPERGRADGDARRVTDRECVSIWSEEDSRWLVYENTTQHPFEYPTWDGISLFAAERRRQKGNIPCWRCKASGKGRERLNHMDNSPTGDYEVCFQCKGKKVSGWSVEDDAKRYSQSELAMAAVCYASPERLYRTQGGGVCITFVDPWPGSWDQSWDKRMKRPVDPNLTGSKLELRLREVVKAGALLAAEADVLLLRIKEQTE